MEKPLRALFLERAKKYMDGIPATDKGTVLKDIECLVVNETDSIYIKQLRGSIRELIVGHHRITYFKLKNALYFVSGFRKKSAKTPKQEIEYAQKTLNYLKSQR